MALHILFRLGAGTAVTPTINLTGGWGAGGLVGYRPGQPHRIRRLSELDEPEDELLFTPEEVIEAKAAELSEADRQRILADVFGRFADVQDRALKLRLERQALDQRIAEAKAAFARELDEEDELMMLL